MMPASLAAPAQPSPSSSSSSPPASSESPSSSTTTAFRLFDLPTEIRVIIWDMLIGPNTIKLVRWPDGPDNNNKLGPGAHLILKQEPPRPRARVVQQDDNDDDDDDDDDNDGEEEHEDIMEYYTEYDWTDMSFLHASSQIRREAMQRLSLITILQCYHWPNHMTRLFDDSRLGHPTLTRLRSLELCIDVNAIFDGGWALLSMEALGRMPRRPPGWCTPTKPISKIALLYRPDYQATTTTTGGTRVPLPKGSACDLTRFMLDNPTALPCIAHVIVHLRLRCPGELHSAQYPRPDQQLFRPVPGGVDGALYFLWVFQGLYRLRQIWGGGPSTSSRLIPPADGPGTGTLRSVDIHFDPGTQFPNQWGHRGCPDASTLGTHWIDHAVDRKVLLGRLEDLIMGRAELDCSEAVERLHRDWTGGLPDTASDGPVAETGVAG